MRRTSRFRQLVEAPDCLGIVRRRWLWSLMLANGKRFV
jgi:hypothetical protein